MGRTKAQAQSVIKVFSSGHVHMVTMELYMQLEGKYIGNTTAEVICPVLQDLAGWSWFAHKCM